MSKLKYRLMADARNIHRIVINENMFAIYALSTSQSFQEPIKLLVKYKEYYDVIEEKMMIHFSI